ncbi:protein NRT1/ PTR FAMILY 1.2-like [Pistacia vera]|uniref:protein NRT1/ PTR FAMILY 1.2-like n=1 Tax=Pistacia vera TaxID=55513 RepID=UPI0012637F5B|nr:protein NRT1/ PTR FAMILY 1.2-like [Pistacia vera]
MENVKRIVAEVKMESSLNENMIQQSSRPKKGGFRTMPFIIVNESFEKVAGYGLMPNMIFYLMNGYHIATANGATMLAMWSATSNALAIVGAFLSDSYIGRFWAILLGSFSSLLVSL